MLQGARPGDVNYSQQRKYYHMREGAHFPCLLCIYAIPCICSRTRLYVTEKLMNPNKDPQVSRYPRPETLRTLTSEAATVLTTVFVLVALHCVAQKRSPGGSPPFLLVEQASLSIASIVPDGNCEDRGYLF